MRVQSTLAAAEETLVSRIMDCGFAVDRILGSGFREKIYHRAFCLELHARGLQFESEKRIEVKYKHWSIPGQTVDLLVEGLVLVEIKTVPKLRSLYRRQILSLFEDDGPPDRPSVQLQCRTDEARLQASRELVTSRRRGVVPSWSPKGSREARAW